MSDVQTMSYTLNQFAADIRAALKADAGPGAKAVVIPGCDHFSMIAHGLFKASVFDFFDGWLE